MSKKFLLAFLMVAGCSNGPDMFVNSDAGTDSDTDTDTDGDADTDTDADTDSDTDSDTDTDTDSDSDSNTDSDTDSDSDSDTDSDGDTDTGDTEDTESESESESESETDTDTDPLNCSGGRYESAASLCWQDPPFTGVSQWSAAASYCDTLILGGFDTWYLPGRGSFEVLLGGCSINETSGIGYCTTCSSSSLCASLFPGDLDDYWTATNHYADGYWHAGMDDGVLRWDYPGNSHNVRCVRSSSGE